MIASHETRTPKQAFAEYSEWSAMYSESVFVILQVYADESLINDPENKKETEFANVAGYIATADYWRIFCKQWTAVLKKYDAPYFHFREFADKLHPEKDNPFLNWDDERRDNFLYDLAMVAGNVAVPVGGLYPVKQHRKLKRAGDPYKIMFDAFFSDFREAMSEHWPELTGRTFAKKVHFIFDIKTNSDEWTKALLTSYRECKKADHRFGGLTWEDDKDPKHLPLQAADMFVYSARQQSERLIKNDRQLQSFRILDIVLNKNLRPPSIRYHLPRFIKERLPYPFETVIEMFRAHKKEHDLWREARGLPKKQYFPFIDFPFSRYQS